MIIVYCIYIVRSVVNIFFFFNETATTEIYTLSLHDALPILKGRDPFAQRMIEPSTLSAIASARFSAFDGVLYRSEEHTSELQSRPHLVCRLLLEKKKSTPHALLCRHSTYTFVRLAPRI